MKTEEKEKKKKKRRLVYDLPYGFRHDEYIFSQNQHFVSLGVIKKTNW